MQLFLDLLSYTDSTLTGRQVKSPSIERQFNFKSKQQCLRERCTPHDLQRQATHSSDRRWIYSTRQWSCGMRLNGPVHGFHHCKIPPANPTIAQSNPSMAASSWPSQKVSIQCLLHSGHILAEPSRGTSPASHPRSPHRVRHTIPTGAATRQCLR